MTQILYFDADEFCFATDSVIDYLKNYLKIENVCFTKNIVQAERLFQKQCFDLIIFETVVPENRRKTPSGYENVDLQEFGLNFIKRIRQSEITGPSGSSVPLIMLTRLCNMGIILAAEKIGKINNGRFRLLQRPVRLTDIGTAIKDLSPKD
ncbi:MAG: hypothetical protein PHT40_03460 [Patescibacteria group bacterium]|nr:hypothetical protein [Patescibacteria group bacterium]